MARSGILKQVSFPDTLSNQFQQNVGDAFDKVCADADILRFPATSISASGPISPGKTVVVYKGTPGATLMLPAASAQGSSVAAVVMVGNESTGVITIQPTGGDTVNGATSLSVSAGAVVVLLADGVSKWLSLAQSAAPYDVVANRAFSAVSSVSATWTAGKYRRLELHLRVTASGAGNATVALTGLGGTYTSWDVYNFGVAASPSPWTSSASAAAWVLQNGAYAGQTDVDFQVASGGLRTFKGSVLDATNGYLLLAQGSNTDTTTNVTGLTVTFPGATSGWLELLGFV